MDKMFFPVCIYGSAGRRPDSPVYVFRSEHNSRSDAINDFQNTVKLHYFYKGVALNSITWNEVDIAAFPADAWQEHGLAFVEKTTLENLASLQGYAEKENYTLDFFRAAIINGDLALNEVDATGSNLGHLSEQDLRTLTRAREQQSSTSLVICSRTAQGVFVRLVYVSDPAWNYSSELIMSVTEKELPLRTDWEKALQFASAYSQELAWPVVIQDVIGSSFL